eukprot:CAMPEP_0206184958 /NCGR_PEP_ID=MMETSP0166-20121206/1513_1 /ASSEMBLY_ACC=CAM_ASM_000260 /TAXON_ID=95228 /ORGANISM="Vannella robusta, Strain DIVA3 518/3/11/1/6" /LENGTH=71 /DNA_ID=CAMNT_0053600043 /DNA_START=299 /DNA_END=511 /DNA_ORIENTATION=-
MQNLRHREFLTASSSLLKILTTWYGWDLTPSTVDETFNEASGIVMALPQSPAVEQKTSVANLALSPSGFDR